MSSELHDLLCCSLVHGLQLLAARAEAAHSSRDTSCVQVLGRLLACMVAVVSSTTKCCGETSLQMMAVMEASGKRAAARKAAMRNAA
jgi:hypothetical protein